MRKLLRRRIECVVIRVLDGLASRSAAAKTVLDSFHRDAAAFYEANRLAFLEACDAYTR